MKGCLLIILLGAICGIMVWASFPMFYDVPEFQTHTMIPTNTVYFATGTPAPVYTDTPTPIPPTIDALIIFVKDSNVNVRNCPSMQCAVNNVVRKGELVRWKWECYNGWAKIEGGWIYSKYLVSDICSK